MALGLTEVLVILAIFVLLLLMPKKLPELARALGTAKKEFKKAQEEPKKKARK
ncbi:MAG: twin-arginine translocase TatA/TatE family subunit [Candidatus Woesearchaeota archaeon]